LCDLTYLKIFLKLFRDACGKHHIHSPFNLENDNHQTQDDELKQHFYVSKYRKAIPGNWQIDFNQSRSGLSNQDGYANEVGNEKHCFILKARQEVGSVMSSLPRYRDCHLSPGQSRFFTTLVKATPEMKTMEQAIRQAGGGK
jgi:hypothetical protein